MSLLEDCVLRIIELRQAQKSHAAVARTLHIPKKSILQYESSLKASLQEAVEEGVGTLGELATKLKMSRTVAGMAMEYFGLKIPETAMIPPVRTGSYEKREYRVEQIAKLAGEGKTRREIAFA